MKKTIFTPTYKTLNRRDFLKYVTAAGLLMPLSGIATGTSRASNAFKVPPLDTGKRTGNTLDFNLQLNASKHQFFKGVNTATIGINQSYLGPVLRAKQGDTVRINVNNQMGVSSSVHWHGMILPANMDGGPHQEVKRGESWTSEYPIRQQASTLWYHSHHMHQTGAQVYHGLAGMFIIDDEGSQQLGLPQEYGIDDLPCTIQDRRFNRDGSFAYLGSMHDRMMGMEGGTILVNGVVTPTLKAQRTLLRLRLHNGSNARVYQLAFSDERNFQVIASDGGFLAAPVVVNSLRLAVGERVEILVDVSDKQVIELRSEQASSGGMMGMMSRMTGGSDDLTILTIDATQAKPSAHQIPKTLRAMTAIPDPKAATATRQFDLQMGMMGGFRINGKSMELSRIDFQVKRNSTEIWEVRNDSSMAHPFHVHNVQFHILDRNGKQPSAIESGLKDTVLVERGEVVRLVMTFPEYSDAKTPYMYHCHILEHEDQGMMGQFVVV